MNDKHLPPLHLDAAFSDIAASAAGSASDGTAGAIQVHRLVKRSRRQRAAALGSASFLVLGAAGLGLSGLLSPAPVEIRPALPVPDPPSEVVEPLDGSFAPACGEDLSDLRPTTTPLTLGPAAPGSAGAFDVVNTGDVHRTVASTGYVALYLLDAEGRVTSAPSMPEPLQVLDLDPGEAGPLAPAGIGQCGDGDAPAPGTYSAVGLLTADVTTGEDTARGTIVGGPWEIAIDNTGMLTSIAGRTASEPPDETPTTPAPPEAPVAGSVNPGGFPSPTFTFPQVPLGPIDDSCSAPALTPEKADALARLTFDQPRVTMQSGSTATVGITLAAVPNARVDYDDFDGIITWSIAQDGKIVAHGDSYHDRPGEGRLDEQKTRQDDFEITARSCASADGKELPYGEVGANLPPGDYQLYALRSYTVQSYALRLQDGTWGAVNDSSSLRPPWFYSWGLITAPIPVTIT